MTCRNCAAPNPPGATHCHRCRMPGDFGQAPAPTARVIPAAVVDCGNCGGHAPARAQRCPTCRFPLPAQSASSPAQSDSLGAERLPPPRSAYPPARSA